MGTPAHSNGAARADDRRAKRYQTTVATIERWQRKLDKADRVVQRAIRMIAKLERQRKRLANAIEKAKPLIYTEQKAEILDARPGETLSQSCDRIATEMITAPADDLDIPAQFRRPVTNEADERAKAEILAAQAEKKKVKAKASAEKSKAKAKGDLRRMPLQGKAALEVIKRG